jgi:hypothetical protein
MKAFVRRSEEMSKFAYEMRQSIVLAATLAGLLVASPAKAEVQTFDCGLGNTIRIDTKTHKLTYFTNGRADPVVTRFAGGVYYYGVQPGRYPRRFYPNGYVEILNIRPPLQPGETLEQAQNRGSWEENAETPGVPVCHRIK